jgi:hypothetical protein
MLTTSFANFTHIPKRLTPGMVPSFLLFFQDSVRAESLEGSDRNHGPLFPPLDSAQIRWGWQNVLATLITGSP